MAGLTSDPAGSLCSSYSLLTGMEGGLGEGTKRVGGILWIDVAYLVF